MKKIFKKYLNNVVKTKKFLLCNEIPDSCDTYIVAVGTPLKYDKKLKFNSNLMVSKIYLSNFLKESKKPLVIFRFI